MNPTVEANDPYCLRPGEAAALLGGGPWRRLLIMGDSIGVHPGDPVAGYEHRTWAQRLHAALAGPEFRNLGVAGARAAGIRAAQLGPAVDFGPDLVVLAAGANDALRRDFDPAAVEAELDTMIGAFPDALVITLGCFPAYRADVANRLRRLGYLTERACRRRGGLHVDFSEHPARQILGEDRLHINARGHAVVAAEVIRALSRRTTSQVLEA